MVKYKEYKGKYVFWAKKGTKGRGKPTGRIVYLRYRRPSVWIRGTKGSILSYKRVQPIKKSRRRTRRTSYGFGFRLPRGFY